VLVFHAFNILFSHNVTNSLVISIVSIVGPVLFFYVLLLTPSKVFFDDQALLKNVYLSVIIFLCIGLVMYNNTVGKGEFTEWIHTIDPSIYDNETLTKWIIANSSHVIDTVFHLIGFPKDLNTIVGGVNEIIWHPSGSVFTGSGISEKNIPFSYNTDWSSAGRWSIEIFTNKRRFYLKPMEKLFEQKKGSINISEISLDADVDENFKPGLYKQTQAFLNSDFSDLVSIDEQIRALSIYEKIGGY
jgi:hypothetical protein